MMNFAFIELIEVVCSRSLENNEIFLKFYEDKHLSISKQESDGSFKEKPLLVDHMCNLADLVVQRIFLEHHYIDYQWPNSTGNDNDENIENEVETIKLFIERDVYVQNMIENPKNRIIIWTLLDFLAQGLYFDLIKLIKLSKLM